MAKSKASIVENEKASKVPSKETVKANPIKYYLIAYNAISALAWAYVLVGTIGHLTGLTAYSKLASPTTPSSTASKFLSYLPFIKKSMSISSQFQARLPSALVPLYTRSSTLWGAMGPQTTWIQTMALMEVIHSLCGWVRSPIQTTLMQIASRLYAVWIVLECYEVARINPLVASMYLAWSITEVLRYSYYVFSLLPNQEVPYPLVWLRYTTFYILYPVGASSEAFLNYATLPNTSPTPSRMMAVIGKSWYLTDYFRGLLFLIWWPSLYFLYTYMIKQRRKVLGSGRKLKSQ